MSHGVGTLVKARGREWVVLPDSTDDLLVLRPLGGTDDEIAGILPALEEVAPATFDLPDPTDIGDARNLDELPTAARDYVLYLSERANVPVSYVGVGPERLQTVAL